MSFDDLLTTQDPQYFVKAHSKMGLGSDHSYATLRLLYYPPLPPDIDIKPGQLRCGEHVDYDTRVGTDNNGYVCLERER